MAYHIAQILQNRAEIESYDLLIIDHYVNDAQFYFGFFGDRYGEFLELFYKLLATLNVPVLNIMFPAQKSNFAAVPGLVREAADKHRITTVDLFQAGFLPRHFKDDIHINQEASFMVGVFLSKSLAGAMGHRPEGGALMGYPLRVIPAGDVAPDLPLQQFENRVSKFEFVQLDAERQLPLVGDESVCSVGYFRGFKVALQQGFVLDGKPCGFLEGDRGFFQEMASLSDNIRTTIAPMVGAHQRIKVLARKARISGEFGPPCLSNVIAYDPSRAFSGKLANHQLFDVPMDGLVDAVDAASAQTQVGQKNAQAETQAKALPDAAQRRASPVASKSGGGKIKARCRAILAKLARIVRPTRDK